MDSQRLRGNQDPIWVLTNFEKVDIVLIRAQQSKEIKEAAIVAIDLN